MVVGKQRSGMDDILARKIANFAYEYSRGYKIGEKDKYKNQKSEVRRPRLLLRHRKFFPEKQES